jgi:prevent-host-death family protein
MSIARVTASEFQHSFGTLTDRARREPLVITKHGRDSLVVMPVEEWERLTRRDRRAGATADLPDDWLDAIQDAEYPEGFEHLDAELD